MVLIHRVWERAFARTIDKFLRRWKSTFGILLTVPATIDHRRRPLLSTVGYVKALMYTANGCMYTRCSISEMIHVVYTLSYSYVLDEKQSKSEINRPLWRRRWSVGIAPYILKLVTVFNSVLRFTLQPLYPSSKSPVAHRTRGCLGPLQKKRELPSRSRPQTSVAQFAGCHIKCAAGKQPPGRYMPATLPPQQPWG